MPANKRLTDLADFIVGKTSWIIDQWSHAVTRSPRIPSADDLPYEELVDHLPYLLLDLAQRLSEDSLIEVPKEAAHGRVHGRRRWEQGYTLAEVVREFGIIRAATTRAVELFARETPAFAAAERAEADKIINQFFTNALAHSAQQFETEQRSAFKASQQDRQAILDSALDCIIVMDEPGIIREWNAAAAALFGYPREEAVGTELAELIVPPELRAPHRAGLNHFRKTGEGPLLGRRIEVPAVRADGTSIQVELAIMHHRTETGALFTAYLRDITERVRSEKRRDAQYEIATLLFDDQPLRKIAPAILEKIAASGTWIFAALWMLEKDGSLRSCATWKSSERQAVFEEKTRHFIIPPRQGLPVPAIESGDPIWYADVLREEKFPRHEAALEAGMRGALFFPLAAPGGIKGVIELMSDTVLTPDADLIQLAGTLGRQIGLYLERKETAEELQRQKETAEAASRAKDRFLAALSHELRTPLTPVLMWACATSGDENLPEEIKEGLAMICRNIEMEARLIDDLLDLTRIAQGKLQLHLQFCEGDRLLQHALEIVRSQLSGKRLRVSVSLQASNHFIQVDPTRIEQVFWNLLKNAQKFTPENGQIALRSYDAEPGIVAFEIANEGKGIDASVMPKLFTAFEQGAPGAGGGLGLGLAICKAIVEMHGGTITATNRPDGAAFTFTLKTALPAAEQPPTDHPAAPVGSRSLRILIVEDDESTVRVMQRLLQNAKHEVVTATTVRDAIALIQKQEFDLVVSDLGLPDGSGHDLMREASRKGGARGIAVSGYGMEDDIERSREAGFSAHLTKPINVQDLTETIAKVTRI